MKMKIKTPILTQHNSNLAQSCSDYKSHMNCMRRNPSYSFCNRKCSVQRRYRLDRVRNRPCLSSGSQPCCILYFPPNSHYYSSGISTGLSLKNILYCSPERYKKGHAGIFAPRWSHQKELSWGWNYTWNSMNSGQYYCRWNLQTASRWSKKQPAATPHPVQLWPHSFWILEYRCLSRKVP